jgi:hypothetical protein
MVIAGRERRIDAPFADGNAASLRGREPTEFDPGTWSICENKFCVWKKIEPRQTCLAAVTTGSKIQLFDSMSLTFIEARVIGG